jgi:hypothetical protein
VPRKSGAPKEVVGVELAQARCPKGHVLPNRTNRGKCTPVYCAGATAGSNSKQPEAETVATKVKNPDVNNALRSALSVQKAEILAAMDARADEVIDRLLPGETPEMLAARAAAKTQKADELQKIGHQVGRFAAKAAVFKTPEGLTGADAEEYFKREAENLLPSIIVDLKQDLQMGDDAQRREARRDILDIVGKRKQDNAPNAHSVFVFVNPTGSKGPVRIPWSASGRTINVTPKSLPSGPGGSEEPKGPKGSKEDKDA